MGVGKTTVGKFIADKTPGTAFIDGDWCLDIHPFVGNRETKAMAVDNILHMIGNYKNCSECRMIVLIWLMNKAKEVAVTQGRRTIILETQSYNTNAIGFYLHQGFELIGFDTCCYTNNDIGRHEYRINLGYFFHREARRK